MTLYNIWSTGALITGGVACAVYGFALMVSLGFPTTTGKDVLEILGLLVLTAVAWPVMIPWTIWKVHKNSQMTYEELTGNKPDPWDYCEPANGCMMYGKCETHGVWSDDIADQFDNSDDFH
jgi:hypothetical protein